MSPFLVALLSALSGAVVGALCTGAVTYFVGRRHGREQLRYGQRVEAVKGLFPLMREVQWELVNAAAPSDVEFEGNPSRRERADTMSEKLQELDAYRRDNSAWLPEEANERISELVDVFHEALQELLDILEEGEDEDAVVEKVHDKTAEGTGDKMFEVFDELVKSL